MKTTLFSLEADAKILTGDSVLRLAAFNSVDRWVAHDFRNSGDQLLSEALSRTCLRLE